MISKYTQKKKVLIKNLVPVVLASICVHRDMRALMMLITAGMIIGVSVAVANRGEAERTATANYVMPADKQEGSNSLKLPDVISDHMVIQANEPVRIWGWATPGENVQASIASQTVTATADSNGAWSVYLRPMEASTKSYVLVVTLVRSGEQLTVEDVLVGDVWLASGQSNMAFPVRAALDANHEIASADLPAIRVFQTDRVALEEGMADYTAGRWVVCSPETAGGLTAVGYFYSRALFQQTGRPQGVLSISWAGTPIESWMSRKTLLTDPDMASVLGRGGPNVQQRPTTLYRSLIAPMFPYTLRGILWCQGENNSGRPIQYRKLFPALIREWRAGFGNPAMPFLYVQLATRGDVPVLFQADSNWALLREAQTMALAEPATAMVIAHDLGRPGNVHYRNKQEVGRRLAFIALRDIYDDGPQPISPRFDRYEIAGNRMVVHFDTQADGLRAEEKIPGFMVAGKNGRFVPATASVTGPGEVQVWCESVPEPVAVRYAWSDYPIAGLQSRSGLPVGTFRTDEWE